MPRHPFTLPHGQLPSSLPLFPLANAVCLPAAQLPLNIFEPRYLNMVFDALAADRMIGMIQPEPDSGNDPKNVPLFQTGTAGRIGQFSETSDGRLLIVLTGVCRFDILSEIPTTRGYRRAIINWNRFKTDYDDDPTDDPEAHEYFLDRLKAYFETKQIDTSWQALQDISILSMVHIFTSQLPFSAAERQSIVEAVSPEDRMQAFLKLLNFALADAGGESLRRH